LLAEYFIKGTKIQVVIESIENEKCSLVFDKTNELNRKVLQEINEKFNALKTITDNSTYAQ
jgi:hypothetical protein